MPADLELIAAPMGGGWAVPHTDTGRTIGAAVMGEPAVAIAPLGDVPGWILEPADAVERVDAMLGDGATVQTVSGRVLP